MFDVFISYRHCDATAVHELTDALRAVGLEVWQDASEIEDFASIQAAINSGLEHSKALLAWYSSSYPLSLACQWELTRAFTAAQQEGDPRRRVLLINPELSNTHIHPVELRDALYRSAGDREKLRAAASAIHAHLNGLNGVFGEIHRHARPNWYGVIGGDGSSRFFGRLTEMWAIHSGLWSTETPIITDRNERPLVRLTGMAGTGKSLTAEMYALRFSSAYPGGIFWLRGFGHDAAPAMPNHEEARDSQIADFANQLGINTTNRAELKDTLARTLDALGAYLWIVDDLPSDIEWVELQAYLAPGKAGHTLITTRNGTFDWAGSEVELESLDETSAVALLTHARVPVNETEEIEALALARDLCCHPLALELAGAGLRTRSFTEFRDNLASSSRDALDFAAELLKARVGSLPHRDSNNLNLSQALLMSVDELDARGKDVLRIASRLAPVRIVRDIVAGALAAVDSMDSADAKDAADIAVASIALRSLARELDAGALQVHPLVARTMRFRDTAPDRTESLRLAAIGVIEGLLGNDIFDARLHVGLADLITHTRFALKDVFGEPLKCVLAELRLLDALYVYDFNHGDYEEARRVAVSLITYALEHQGAEHPHTLIFTSYLGEVERMVGNLAVAYDIHNKLLETRSRLGDPEKPVSAHNLALVMHAQGNLAGARELQEMVYKFRLEHQGQEHPATLQAMHNLANTLCDFGDIDAAYALVERVVELRRKVLGEGHRDTQESLLVLANILRRVGRISEAKDIDAAVTDYRSGSGDNLNLDSLTAMNNLAVSLHSEGKWDEASKVMEKVWLERKQLLGPTHPDSIASLTSLAGILYSKKDYRSALDCAERALAAIRQLPGGDYLHLVRAAYYVVLSAIAINSQSSWTRIRELADNDLAALLKNEQLTFPQTERDMWNFIVMSVDASRRETKKDNKKHWWRFW